MEKINAFKSALSSGKIEIAESTAKKVVAYLELEKKLDEVINSFRLGSEEIDNEREDKFYSLFAPLSEEIMNSITEEIGLNIFAEASFRGI